MFSRKTVFTMVVLIVAAFCSFVAFWPDNNLHMVACNVGQGDAILFTQGFNQVLIDGGPNDKVLGCLARHIPFWDKKIEVVINTHSDNDHLKGLVSVLGDYQVTQLVINSIGNDSDVFKQFHQEVIDNHIKIHSPQQGERVKLGGIELQVLWPEKVTGDIAMWQKSLEPKQAVLGAQTSAKPNESSIVVMAKYGKFKALLPGDLPGELEPNLVSYCSFGSCGGTLDVLKVSHHGSKTSSTEKFLDYFRPKEAVISVGQNSFGHPTQEVLDRLTGEGAKILRTDLLGDVVIITDGKNIW